MSIGELPERRHGIFYFLTIFYFFFFASTTGIAVDLLSGSHVYFYILHLELINIFSTSKISCHKRNILPPIPVLRTIPVPSAPSSFASPFSTRSSRTPVLIFLNALFQQGHSHSPVKILIYYTLPAHITRFICIYNLKFIVVMLSLPPIIILNSKIGPNFLPTNIQKSIYLHQRKFRLLLYNGRL